MKRECCVLIYNSFGDPLFQNIMFQYMKTLVRDSGWAFHLITFEQPQYKISPHEKESLILKLRSENIHWYPQKHHTGKLLIIKKLWDFISISVLLFTLRLRGVKILWSFANVAASISWAYSKMFRFKSIIYSYEPHSSFMVELGIWKSNSLRYRILNYLECRAGRDAHFVLTGTKYMVTELNTRGAKGVVYRAPTSVDENDFYFRKEGRQILEIRHGFLKTDRIILYVGKFGGLYYTNEIPFLFKILQDNILNCRFIVVSPTPYDEVKGYFNEVSFDINEIVYLTNLSYDDVKIYISGADLGISAVPPTPSQKFRSPTKVAEYLLCGLPYVTCQGVSEDDSVACEFNVGIVVKDFSSESILSAVPQIREILEIGKEKIVQRCRNVGLSYRSKQNVDQILKNIFEKLTN